MDPRCYFSSTWWRKGKQALIDEAKQRARLWLLRKGGSPLLGCDAFLANYERLLQSLRRSGAKVCVLSLPPVSEKTFPGTMPLIEVRNSTLRALCARQGIDFLCWDVSLPVGSDEHRCRDGFHPNEKGARAMADRLAQYLSAGSSQGAKAKADAR
jgi:lysophospholipase L1-like esterase